MQLQGLKLAKEPAENVESFAEKVTDIAKRIQGTGPDTCPQDLPTLVYECFLGSSTSIFKSNVVLSYNKANRGEGLGQTRVRIQGALSYLKNQEDVGG